MWRLRFYFVVIRTVGRLFDARVFLLVANLNADDRVHVETGQLSRFDHRNAHLHVTSSYDVQYVHMYMYVLRQMLFAALLGSLGILERVDQLLLSVL